MVKQKHLTIFAIFELMDQNRDEGTGNFQTLKKVKRLDGVYTFISKYSFRHHLFNELKETAGWKEAAVTVDKQGGEKAVIQFDLSEDDILTSPEIDAFGYMFTISGDNAITRKAAVGLTDLVSLEPYNGDSAFYANHDMVRRAIERGYDASPNPFGKEEHFSFYKGGITINTNRLGIDEWIISKKPKEEQGALIIKIKSLNKNEQKELQVEEINLDEVNIDLPKEVQNKIDKADEVKFYKINNTSNSILIVIIEGKTEKTKEGKKKKGIIIYADGTIEEVNITKEEEKEKIKKVVIELEKYLERKITIDNNKTNQQGPNLPDNLNWVLEKYDKLLEDIKVYKTEDGKGYIIVGKIIKGNKYKVLFVLNPQEKEKRIKELIEAVRGGIKFQVGGRDYALVPILLIVALMKSPLQVFFPHIGVTVGENKKYRILGLQSALDNPKVEKVFIEYNKDRLICEYKTNKEIGCLEDIYKELFGNQENFKNQEDSNNEG